MPITSTHYEEIQSLLQDSEIFRPGSEEYNKTSMCWWYNLDKKPSLILQPKSLDTLQKVVKYLYTILPWTLAYALRVQVQIRLKI
jgi:hypothetical protein